MHTLSPSITSLLECIAPCSSEDGYYRYQYVLVTWLWNYYPWQALSQLLLELCNYWVITRTMKLQLQIDKHNFLWKRCEGFGREYEIQPSSKERMTGFLITQSHATLFPTKIHSYQHRPNPVISDHVWETLHHILIWTVVSHGGKTHEQLMKVEFENEKISVH